MLVSANADFLGALSLGLGPQFVVSFRVFQPYLFKNYKLTRPVSDRSMVIGTISEIISGMQEVSEFTEGLYTLLMKALSDPDEEVRSNAAFGMGVLVQFTEINMSR